MSRDGVEAVDTSKSLEKLSFRLNISKIEACLHHDTDTAPISPSPTSTGVLATTTTTTTTAAAVAPRLPFVRLELTALAMALHQLPREGAVLMDLTLDSFVLDF